MDKYSARTRCSTPQRDLLERIHFLTKSKNNEAQFPEMAQFYNQLTWTPKANTCNLPCKKLVCTKCSTPLGNPFASKISFLDDYAILECRLCQTKRKISLKENHYSSTDILSWKICPSLPQGHAHRPLASAGQQE